MRNQDNYPDLSTSTYEVREKIGSGGSGVVYKAWHRRLQKYVVIKELKHASFSDIETQRNEVEALKNVKSDYLPQVFDFIVKENHIYTVMEFIEGKSFEDLLKEGKKFSQSEVLKWYKQLAQALSIIHSKNIYHRDIKPANIMIMDNGNACLIDFNAALVKGNDINLVSRSLGYASPEQYEIYENMKNRMMESDFSYDDTEALRLSIETLTDNPATITLQSKDENSEFNNENVDWSKSDIYSLGATMYHILTGCRPSEKAAEVVALSEFEGFSEGVLYVVEQSMKINPSERFSSVDTVLNILNNIYLYDSRWRKLKFRKKLYMVILFFLFFSSSTLAVSGKFIMEQEKENLYFSYINLIQSAQSASESREYYGYAFKLFNNRIDPYYAMVSRFWNDGLVVECKEYIENNNLELSKFQSVEDSYEKLADIYYILGNCYYLENDVNYEKVSKAFELALKYDKKSNYYRDYAISLARLGELEKAKEMIAEAESLGISSYSLTLLNAELSFSKNDFSNATKYYHEIISNSTNPEILYHAYKGLDEIYLLSGELSEEIDLLKSAIRILPFQFSFEFKEKLGGAFYRNNELDNAIKVFEELIQERNTTFNIYQNLVILYQLTEKYDTAYKILIQLLSDFPDDYRVAMRIAFLEADMQIKKANEMRDYSVMKKYYDIAYEQYQNRNDKNIVDIEMQKLEILIEQLKFQGWISK